MFTNPDQQYINNLESELNWEREVVVKDLEDKLSHSLQIIQNLTSILYDIPELLNADANNQAFLAYQFCNENILHIKNKVDLDINNLPF